MPCANMPGSGAFFGKLRRDAKSFEARSCNKLLFRIVAACERNSAGNAS